MEKKDFMEKKELNKEDFKVLKALILETLFRTVFIDDESFDYAINLTKIYCKIVVLLERDS